MVDVEVKGIENFDRLVGVLSNMGEALHKGALLIERKAKLKFIAITKPYPNPVGDPGVPHSRTGRLRGSIEGIKINFLEAAVVSNVKYGKYLESANLEVGTSKRLPRPFMRPAALDNRVEVERVISNHLKQKIKVVIK